MPRSRLGPLAVESKLGDHPSQSSVWRALHVQLKRALAVKVFSVPFGSTPEARGKLAREWEDLKKLQHPAIVTCYGGGFEDSDAYLAYELIEGETLAAQLERVARLPWETVLDLAETVIDALAYLHEREIIHGRLQPDKVILAGLSPVLVDIRTQRVTSPYKSNRPLTLPEYRFYAPELIADANAVSNDTDLYALGVLLYLAITGRTPINGDDQTEIAENIVHQIPESVASIVFDCPIWFDKLIMQLLAKDPAARPHSAKAVQLALAEVRRRSMSRTSAVEHASAGFSPLNVNDQKERDEARLLLGHAALESEQELPDESSWYEKTWFLIAALAMIVALVAYLAWPLSEDQMRQRAERLLAQQSRSAASQAKISYLEPMLNRYPEGRHSDWAREQIDQVEMLNAEHFLQVKLNRNLPLSGEGERLYAEALEYERFDDVTTALDRYHGIVTLLGDDPQYRPFVNLAKRQIAAIENEGGRDSEAMEIIQAKLDQADQLHDQGKVVAARKIWYSIVRLYEHNDNVTPLVVRAQDRLAGSTGGGPSDSPPNSQSTN